MFAFFLFFFTMVHRSVSDIVRRVHPSFWAEEPPLEKLQLSSTVYNPAHFPQTNLDLTCFLKIVMEESLSQRFILFVYWINLLLEMTIWIFVSIWISFSFFVYICLLLLSACILFVRLSIKENERWWSGLCSKRALITDFRRQTQLGKTSVQKKRFLSGIARIT